MYRLLITLSRENAITSTVVEFDSKREADAVAEQLNEQDRRFERHSLIVSKLYED